MIRAFEPLIGKLEKYINKSIDKGFISSSGPSVVKFEDKWAKYCNRKYGVSDQMHVALQLALKF